MPQATDQVLNLYYNNYVMIPDYQREFAWDDVLATQLFDSFNQFLIANPQIAGLAGVGFVGPAAVAPADIIRFYLGTIITVDQNPIPIVDGQQRLTSIAIMASILRDYCIEQGEYGQAHELDRKFCWKVAQSAAVGRSVYSGGTPKVMLRDTGDGVFNLLENMYNICSLNIEPDPPIVYQITNIAGRGVLRNITINQDLDWRLLEDHQLQMDTGQTIAVARTANIGLNQFQVSGADAALINVGDSFELRYGKRIGSAPKGSTYIGKARNKLIENIAETLDGYYVGGGAPAPHLPDLKAYVAQWIAMIDNTEITQIQFDDPGSAMEFFLVVNDKTLEKTLTNLDRLRAQIKIVIEGDCQAIPVGAVIPNPKGVGPVVLAGMGDEEKLNMCMKQDFDTIEEILLNRREKRNAFSKDFFYDFSQVFWPLKNLQGNPRDSKGVMPDINRQYLSDMKNADGDWDKVEFRKFTDEIRIFAGIYCRARDRWSTVRPGGAAVNYLSDVSETDPFEPEVCEKIEEVLLRVLANMGSRKQFRPTYMAGSYVIRRALDDGDITEAEYTSLSDMLCRSLLKMHIALQILPDGTTGDGKTAGEIYAYSDQFVPTITALPAGSGFVDIQDVFEEIKDEIDGEVVSYPPEDPPGRRLPITLDNPSAKPILMLAEWQQRAGPGAMVGGAVLAGAAAAITAATHFHDGPKNYVNEVEHIQPKGLPGAWPIPPRRPRRGAPPPNLNGYTAPDEDTWIENRDRLGNRLLCKRDVNNHARDKPLVWKISNVGMPGPVCPKNPIPPAPARPNYKDCNGTSKHYLGDNRAIVEKWLGAEGVGGWLATAAAPPIATPPLCWGSAEIEKWEKEIVDLLLLILP